MISPGTAERTNPQSLNRYTYVLNGPVRYTDPTGYRTFGIGFGITLGLGAGVSFSVMFVFDDKHNAGIAVGGGGGGYAGAGGSVGFMVQTTDADTIHRLSGPVVQTGGSVDLGLSVGGEWVAQEGPTGPISGVNVIVGAGFTASIPCPIEIHGMLENTVIKTWAPDPLAGNSED